MTPEKDERTRHGMNCAGSRGDEDCTCGLRWRDEIRELRRELSAVRQNAAIELGEAQGQMKRLREDFAAERERAEQANNMLSATQELVADTRAQLRCELSNYREEIKLRQTCERLLAAALDRAEQAEAGLGTFQRTIGVIQSGLQPGGSPPPGDSYVLVSWIVRVTREKIATLTADNRVLTTQLRDEKAGRALQVESLTANEEYLTAENERLKAELKRITEDKDYLFRANVGNEWEDHYKSQQWEIERLKMEGASLRVFVERVQPYLNAIDHIHLPDGTKLTSGDLWDVLNSSTAGSEMLERLKELREGVAWAYQLASLIEMPAKALDNLSALANGKKPQHEWPYPVDCTRITQLEQQHEADTQKIAGLEQTVDYWETTDKALVAVGMKYGWKSGYVWELLDKIIEADTQALREAMEALEPFSKSAWRKQVDQDEWLSIRRAVLDRDCKEFTAGALTKAEAAHAAIAKRLEGRS